MIDHIKEFQLSKFEVSREVAEWKWFFSGLAKGFHAELTMRLEVPRAPLQNHPALIAERKNKPIDWKLVTETSKALPPQYRMWRSLLKAKTVRQVQRLCRESRFWADHIDHIEKARISFNLGRLDELAKPWLAALNEKRFPKSNRPSSQTKQIDFLARAMAGASKGLTARYANEKFSKK